MGIGKKLSEILERKSMNVAELSELTGISKTTLYSMIQRDSSKADIQILFKICMALDVETTEFFEEYLENKKSLPSDEARKALGEEIRQLPPEKIEELLNYARYLKNRE